MAYKVHRMSVTDRDVQEKLELFLNSLEGEIISVFPNVRPTFQLMGATAKVDSLVIVERLGG